MSISLQLLLVLFVTLYFVITFLILQLVFSLKRETSSALVWTGIVIVPVLGPIFFLWFGYDRVYRPLKEKKRQKASFRSRLAPPYAQRGLKKKNERPLEKNLGWLAQKLNGYPALAGNRVTLYHETQTCYDKMLELIDSAEHHIHLEYYIFQPDETGKAVIDKIISKLELGVQVRLLYDSWGSVRLRRGMFRRLQAAGGKCEPFLSMNLWRKRFQMNLRNHRKILIVDGKKAIIGGMNIGREYLGLDKGYGYWRDTNLLLEGPAVASLQDVFIEDWDFATEEQLSADEYILDVPRVGKDTVQVIGSGPDQERNTLRGVVYGAITQARKCVWITTPYFVPDAGLIDALELALRMGLEVKLLIPNKADSWLTYHASRYFLRDLLKEGIQVYQYNKGYLHSKVIIVDDTWALVGSANFDNRSMHLNFEASCALHTPKLVQELKTVFEQDCEESTPITHEELVNQHWWKLASENFARLFAPIL